MERLVKEYRLSLLEKTRNKKKKYDRLHAQATDLRENEEHRYKEKTKTKGDKKIKMRGSTETTSFAF